MKITFLLYGWLCLANVSVLAQNADTVFQQRPYFNFTYDNDFFNATDRYYTQGIRLELGHSFVQKSPIAKLLLPLKKEAFRQFSIALAQDCFTPPGILRDTIQIGERPFSGVFYLSHTSISTDVQKSQQLFTQFDIGIIGSCAQCKEMQMGIHRLLDNIQPRGWQFQLANDIVLNYSLQFEKGILARKRLEWLGYSNVRIGTLYDDVMIGSLLRFGFFKPHFRNESQVNESKLRVHGFVNGNIKLVGYNATLQGGIFNPNDIHTLTANQINRMVASGAIGMILSYQKVSLEFTRFFLSPDYKGGLSHGWGRVNIRVDL